MDLFLAFEKVRNDIHNAALIVTRFLSSSN